MNTIRDNALRVLQHVRLNGIQPLDGFEYLGSGLSRCAFMLDGLVYKVEHDDLFPQNDDEWDNYQRLLHAPLPPGVAIPVMQRFDFDSESVMVSEFVMGISLSEMYEDVVEISGLYGMESPYTRQLQRIMDRFENLCHSMTQYGLYDSYSQNCIVDDESVMWLVDLG